MTITQFTHGFFRSFCHFSDIVGELTGVTVHPLWD